VQISELLRIAGNDKKFLVEMIELFIKAMEKGVLGIEKAIENGKIGKIAEHAHKMAAPVKHIGANLLYENIKLLEKLSKQSSPLTTIEPVFQEIKNEIKELNATLGLYLNELKI
jgi:HPt (histidine-containing phosphotransfer) domain-containing protein